MAICVSCQENPVQEVDQICSDCSAYLEENVFKNKPTQPDDGGPAFPQSFLLTCIGGKGGSGGPVSGTPAGRGGNVNLNDTDGLWPTTVPGMSTRTWLAATATDRDVDSAIKDLVPREISSRVAARCHFADALLAELSKPKES